MNKFTRCSHAFPRRVGDTGAVINHTGQHKQQVAQAIEVDDQGAGKRLRPVGATA